MDVPDYSNLNAEELAAKIGLKPKHIPMLIDAFKAESEEILGNLAIAIEQKNYEQIQHHAHSIKGSAGNLKFDKVYELAREMEFAGRDKNSDFDYEGVFRVISEAIGTIAFV